MATRAEIKPTTLRLKVISSTKAPPCLTRATMLYLAFIGARWLACWAANQEVQGRNSDRDFCSTYSSSQLSYDEYTDHALSVGRCDGEGEDWLPAFIC